MITTNSRLATNADDPPVNVLPDHDYIVTRRDGSQFGWIIRDDDSAENCYEAYSLAGNYLGQAETRMAAQKIVASYAPRDTRDDPRCLT